MDYPINGCLDLKEINAITFSSGNSGLKLGSNVDNAVHPSCTPAQLVAANACEAAEVGKPEFSSLRVVSGGVAGGRVKRPDSPVRVKKGIFSPDSSSG